MAAQPGEGGDELSRLQEAADKAHAEYNRLSNEWRRLRGEVVELKRLKESKQDEEKKELEGQLKKAIPTRNLAEVKKMKAFTLWKQRRNEKRRAELVIMSGDTSEVDSKIKRWKEKVVEYEERIKQRQQLLLEIEQDEEKRQQLKEEEENRQLLKEALRGGSVKMRYIVCITLGLAGVGKTCLTFLLMGAPPPGLRTSTTLGETPIRIEIRRISEMKLRSSGEQWTEVNNEEMLEIVASLIILASEQYPDSEMFEVIKESGDESGNEAKPQSVKKENFLSKFVRWITRKEVSQPQQPPPSCPPGTHPKISASSSEACKKSVKIIMDKLVKIIARLRNVSSSSQVVAKHSRGQSRLSLNTALADWVYLSDCGGQPEYHELLPLFIRHLSAALCVVRLPDKLDKVQPVEYFKENQAICLPQQSQLSAKDTLKCLVNTIHSFSTKDQKPKVIIVGTHIDELREKEKKQAHSSNSQSLDPNETRDEVETLEDKNEELVEMLESEFGDHLVYYSKDMKQLVFPVNTLKRGEEELEMARLIRKAVETSAAKEVDVPLWWYILELLIQELAKQLERKVISKAECLELAKVLGFKESALEAALQFFDNLNVIKYSPNVLPHIIFTDSQVPLDKLSELITESYLLRGGCASTELSGSPVEGKLKYFRDQGVVSQELLSKFQRYYVPGIFGERDLSDLLKDVLVFAPIPTPQWEKPQPNAEDRSPPRSQSKVLQQDSESKSNSHDSGPYFVMPASLVTLTEDELVEHRVSSTTLATLIVQFPQGSRRAGVFSCFIVHLIRHCGWDLFLDAKVRLFRNCIKFHPKKLSPPVTVTVIDSNSYIEVHANICAEATGLEVARLLPMLKGSIFSGIAAACKALNYKQTYPEIAFFCPEHERESSSGASLKPNLHPASIRPDRKYWCCDVDPSINGRLQSRHRIWFGIVPESQPHVQPVDKLHSSPSQISAQTPVQLQLSLPVTPQGTQPAVRPSTHDTLITASDQPLPYLSALPSPAMLQHDTSKYNLNSSLQSSTHTIAPVLTTSACLNLPTSLVSTLPTNSHSLASSSVAQLPHIPEYHETSSGASDSSSLIRVSSSSKSVPSMEEAQYTFQTLPTAAMVTKSKSSVKYPMEIPEYPSELSGKKQHIPKGDTNPAMASQVPPFSSVPSYPTTQISTCHPTDLSVHSTAEVNQALKIKSDMPDTCKNQKVVKSGQITDPDRLFSDIANYIYDNYINIGIELGLKFNVLENELETGQMRTLQGSKKALKMLQLWRESVKDNDLTYSVLAAALEKHGFENCADKYCYISISQTSE